MSYKTGHKEKAYELLRKSDFNNPFTFADWQLKEKYMAFREKLREQKYTVKDTGISYRHITHWEVSKLMPEGVNVGNRQSEASWRMFSIVEMAWLKIITRLRKFGFSLKQIVKVKEQIIHWNKIYNYYPSFEFCIAQALFSQKDTYLRILANGNAYLISTEQLEMEKILRGGNGDMLLISLKSVLEELGMTPPEIKARLELTDEEFELFDVIRHSGSNEVKAAVKNGQITDMETSKTITELPLDSEIKDEAEKEGMYGRVLTQYEDGKRRSMQIVKRKKFDKK